VPFTSESKEAVAHYPDIIKEIQLAAQECGRKLATFIRKRKAADYQAQRRSIFELYIEEVATAIGKITGRKPGPIKREFLQVAHKVTLAEMKEEEAALAEQAQSKIARKVLRSHRFYQFRLSFDKTQAKGSFKVMADELAEKLEADIILPKSSVKPK